LHSFFLAFFFSSRVSYSRRPHHHL
jgi:hypothetical protein